MSINETNKKTEEFKQRKTDFFRGPDASDPLRARINLIYENINNLMAFFLTNKIKVQFKRKPSDEKKMELVNKKAMSDYKKMKMSQIEHDSLLDMFLCGPGISIS